MTWIRSTWVRGILKLAIVFIVVEIAPSWRPAFAQKVPAPTAPICSTETPATAVAGALFGLFASPNGAPKTQLLAAGSSSKLPGADANAVSVIALYRLTFSSEAQSSTFAAAGPMLLLPESGQIVVALNGTPISLPVGSCLFIETGETYAFANQSGADATVLRLAITSADADNPIGRSTNVTITPAPGETPPPYQVGISSSLRFRLTFTTPSQGVLFLAMITVDASSAPGSPFTHPGVVGLSVTDGQIALTDPVTGQDQQLSTDQCAVQLPDFPYRITPPGEGSANFLMFGVLRDGQSLWIPADPSALSAPPESVPTVECSSPVSGV